MREIQFLCRVLSIQKRKETTFLYVAGFKHARQLLVNNSYLDSNKVTIMSIIKGTCGIVFNNKGEKCYNISNIESIVYPENTVMISQRYTNKAMMYRACRNKIIQDLRHLLEEEGFLESNSPFTIQYRGTSTAAPLKISGKYVDRYCKITHELAIKKAMCDQLQPVYEIGYVARDQYTTVNGAFEYSILEFVTPLHDMSFIEYFVKKIIEIAQKNSKEFGIDTLDLSELSIVNVAALSQSQFYSLKKQASNTLFFDAPVDSPLVKKVNGSRRETIWFVNGVSIAHGYMDENSAENIIEYSNKQLQELKTKGVSAELSWDFIDLLKSGIPNSISIGFGLDRFFQLFFNFNNLKEYYAFLG